MHFSLGTILTYMTSAQGGDGGSENAPIFRTKSNDQLREMQMKVLGRL